MLLTTLVIAGLPMFAPPTAPANMVSQETNYYILETEVPEERAKQIGRHVDAAGKEFFARFQGFSGKIKTKPKVKVFSSKDRFMTEMRKTVASDKLRFKDGFYDKPNEIVYAYDQPNVHATLRKYCLHQYLDLTLAGDAPPWTLEGLGEYYMDSDFNEKTTQLKAGTVTTERAQALNAAQQSKGMMPLEQLMRITLKEWEDNVGTPRGTQQSAQAWALCHFLLQGEAGKHVPLFDKYMREIDKHLDGESAFKKTFGSDIKPLQTKFDVYVGYLISQAPKTAKKETDPAKKDMPGAKSP